MRVILLKNVLKIRNTNPIGINKYPVTLQLNNLIQKDGTKSKPANKCVINLIIVKSPTLLNEIKPLKRPQVIISNPKSQIEKG